MTNQSVVPRMTVSMQLRSDIHVAEQFAPAPHEHDPPAALMRRASLAGLSFLLERRGGIRCELFLFASNPVLDLGSAPQAARRTMVRFCAHE